MNVRVLLLFIILVWHSDAKVYSFEDLYVNAIHNSNKLRSIENELKKADAEVQDVIGASMPQISTSLSLIHSKSHFERDQQEYQQFMDQLLDDPQLVNEDQTALAISKSADLTNYMTRQLKDTIALSLNVKQAVFAQGKIRLGIKLAKIRQRAVVCKYNLEKMKLKSEIYISYYKAILGQEKVKIASEAVTLAEQSHRLAVVTHLVGRSGELDTLNSMLKLEKARIELQNAQSARKMTYETILSQTGINEVSSEFSVEGQLEETDFNLSIDQVLGKMHSNNPSLTRLSGQREIHDNLVSLARSNFYPTIDVGVSLRALSLYDDFDGFNNPVFANDQKIYMVLNWDLFSGLSKIHKLHKAEADRTISLLSQQQILREFDLQARYAHEQVILNRNNLSTSRSLIGLAQKSYLLAKKAYEVGSKTFLDVQNAEFELNNAKIILCEALFSYQCAIVNLKLLMGDI